MMYLDGITAWDREADGLSLSEIQTVLASRG
jgi:hypothetical protein